MRCWDDVKQVLMDRIRRAFEDGDLVVPMPDFKIEAYADDHDPSVCHLTITDTSGFLMSYLAGNSRVGSSLDSLLEEGGINMEC